MDINFPHFSAILVSVFIAYLMPKVSPFFDFVLHRVWLVVSNKMPLFFRSVLRNGRAKRLREIKSKRWSFGAVGYEIAKSNSLFLLFCGVLCIYLLLLVGGPLSVVLKDNFWIGVSISLPIYFFEILWLVQDQKTKKLIGLSSKIRIAYHSSGKL